MSRVPSGDQTGDAFSEYGTSAVKQLHVLGAASLAAFEVITGGRI